jgi:hypothetical protein
MKIWRVIVCSTVATCFHAQDDNQPTDDYSAGAVLFQPDILQPVLYQPVLFQPETNHQV